MKQTFFSNQTKINALRIGHTLIAIYFILCIVYIWYVAIVMNISPLLAVAIGSLAIEGFVVFILNSGHCPLHYVQHKVGDNIPFFELFLSPKVAKQAVPFFSIMTWGAIAILIIRILIKV